MTDAQISVALALAIGWKFVAPSSMQDVAYIFPSEQTRVSEALLFDYREWDVISPIAAKYNCFPIKASDGLWFTHEAATFEIEATPQLAIAMSVINRSKDEVQGL